MKCTYCQTERFRVKTRKYCTRCYPIILELEQNNSTSTRRKKLQRRLDYYKYIEEGINGDVSFFRVENLFRLIAKEAGSKPKDMHLITQYPANMFDQEHLNHFYRMLVVLVEGLPITKQEKVIPIK